jgi:hypothetical protein
MSSLLLLGSIALPNMGNQQPAYVRVLPHRASRSRPPYTLHLLQAYTCVYHRRSARRASRDLPVDVAAVKENYLIFFFIF